MKDKTLSDREQMISNPIYWASKERDKFWEKRIKDFIQKLKAAITHDDGTPCTMVPEIIDKLAGEELSGR